MVRDPSSRPPSLVCSLGGVITNTVQDRGARCRSSVVPPLPDGDERNSHVEKGIAIARQKTALDCSHRRRRDSKHEAWAALPTFPIRRSGDRKGRSRGRDFYTRSRRDTRGDDEEREICSRTPIESDPPCKRGRVQKSLSLLVAQVPPGQAELTRQGVNLITSRNAGERSR